MESDRSNESSDLGIASAAGCDLQHVSDRKSETNAAQASGKTRRLFADQRYFGLHALAIQVGARRALERLAKQMPGQGWVDIRSLGEDFRLDSAAASTLLTAFVVGGMLQPYGGGAYRPTRKFRETLPRVSSSRCRASVRGH